MIERMRSKPKLLVGILLVVGVPWLFLEGVLSQHRLILSVRLAVASGLFFFPLLYILYRYALSGDVTQSLKSVGLSFLIKGAFLVGTTAIFYVLFQIQPIIYTTLLFFVIFSLTFFAISLARMDNPSTGPRRESHE